MIKGPVETLPTPYRCIAVLLGSDDEGHSYGVVARIHRTEVVQGVIDGNLVVVLTLVARQKDRQVIASGLPLSQCSIVERCLEGPKLCVPLFRVVCLL